jgi:aromatic ring-cleaving dioxygenase
MSGAPKDAGTISSWHAHIYYDPGRSKDAAARVRGWIEARFPVRMGSWHDVPVGPHPAAMYQVAFGPEVFPSLIPWLTLNREGLTVLVHPNTDHPREDHLKHALWLGEVLALKADTLPEGRQAD